MRLSAARAPLRAGAAGLELANDLLGRSVVSVEVAEQALERLRQAASAVEASFWTVTDACARCVIRVGDHALGQPLPTLSLTERGIVGDRLRRRSVILCRAGEVTGVEDLVRAAVSSYVVLSCANDANEIGVLAIGWNHGEPPLDVTSISHLQIATGALVRTLPATAGSEVGIAAAILRSLTDRIAVIDRGGVILALNAAWTAPPFNGAEAPPIGTNCFDWYRRAVASATDLRAVVDGVMAVARDGAPMFQATLVVPGSAKDEWSMITATPFCHPGGGAVITHAPARGDGATALAAQRNAERALGEMGSRVVAAQEEERSRIARELHDDLGQQTALLATKIETLLRSSKANATKLRSGIAEAQQTVQDLAISIHNLSHELHPPKLKLLGLVKTLESLCRNVSKVSGMHVSFRSTPIPMDVPAHIALCVCRVAQEALQNAVKHSGAREAAIELSATDSQLVLTVTDGGHGFDASALTDSGIGLTTMRDRVELVGGRLSISASPSDGVTIEASVPFVRSF